MGLVALPTGFSFSFLFYMIDFRRRTLCPPAKMLIFVDRRGVRLLKHQLTHTPDPRSTLCLLLETDFDRLG
jgi:hypothetical protein